MKRAKDTVVPLAVKTLQKAALYAAAELMDDLGAVEAIDVADDIVTAVVISPLASLSLGADIDGASDEAFTAIMFQYYYKEWSNLQETEMMLIPANTLHFLEEQKAAETTDKPEATYGGYA